MKKYIITNCPAYLNYNKCLHNGHCDNITDCLLKRIVDECKEEKVINCNIDGKEQVLNAYYLTKIGDEILELLEIEECKNE